MVGLGGSSSRRRRSNKASRAVGDSGGVDVSVEGTSAGGGFSGEDSTGCWVMARLLC